MIALLAWLLAPETVNDKLDVLRYFFRAAVRDELITRAPTAFVRGLKRGKGVRRPFALDELKKLLAAIMEIIGHASVIINLGYTHTGQQALRRAVETMPDVANG